ncbi:MAG: hypothetical protein Q9M92_04605 [Enterobacterales bacterium]|nr:hypothetical protein [Enterobacterales bacterium]
MIREHSEVVILRPSQFAAGATAYCVLIDNQSLGYLSNGGYLKILLTPGIHRISMPDLHTDLKITTENNKISFVLFNVNLNYIAPIQTGSQLLVDSNWSTGLKVLSEKEGLRMVKQLREAELDDDCD